MWEVLELKTDKDWVQIATFPTQQEAMHFRKMRMRQSGNPMRVQEVK